MLVPLHRGCDGGEGGRRVVRTRRSTRRSDELLGGRAAARSADRRAADVSDKGGPCSERRAQHNSSPRLQPGQFPGRVAGARGGDVGLFSLHT